MLPPLVMVGSLLGIWELLCRGPAPTLPPPSQVVTDTWELIVDPFFDHGGVDKGLFWHLAASLQARGARLSRSRRWSASRSAC